MSIATLLENLITKKYYENKAEIQNKLDVFYAMSKISDEEYTNLTLKVEDVYKGEEEVTEVTEVEATTEAPATTTEVTTEAPAETTPAA